jgi:hypothetical protein
MLDKQLRTADKGWPFSFCKYDNESSGSIKGGEIPERLSASQEEFFNLGRLVCQLVTSLKELGS